MSCEHTHVCRNEECELYGEPAPHGVPACVSGCRYIAHTRTMVAQINAAPEPLRSYIHALETNADPAGTLQEAFGRCELQAQLEAKITELQDEIALMLGELAVYKRLHE